MFNFIDLAKSHRKIEKKLLSKFKNIFKHKKFILGPEVKKFEKMLDDYVGSKAVCVSSGTDALLLSLMALDIKKGDEVITTPFTWGSNSEMIKFVGAKPIYVDVNPKTFNIDENKIKEKITKKTKAIMTVNLFGQCCNYNKIKKIINGRNIYIIEDAAQSFGATYYKKKSCNLGDISCTSFFPSKPLGCYGDGGACFTNNKKLYNRLNILRNHGQIGKNNHVILGHNARMDSIQAAVLIEKLKIFNYEIKLRKKIAKNYFKLLEKKKDIKQLPYVENFNTSVFAQFTLIVKNRDKIIKRFKKNGIPYAIFYPKPLYKQKAFFDNKFKCKFTEKLCKEVISIPFDPYISKKNQIKISKCFE